MLSEIRVVLPDNTQCCPDRTAWRGQVGLHQEARKPRGRAERPCLGSSPAGCTREVSSRDPLPGAAGGVLESTAGALGPPPGCAECPGRCPGRVRRRPPGPPSGAPSAPGGSDGVRAPGPPPGCAECPREVSYASHPALPSASHAFGWGESAAEPPSCPKPLCLFAGPPSQPSLYKGEKGDPGSRITDSSPRPHLRARSYR